ncbi:MAG: hypothetical protein R2813_13610 [Flavobacteriales bacterium]
MILLDIINTKLKFLRVFIEFTFLDSYSIRKGLHQKFGAAEEAEKHFQNLYRAIDFYKVHGEINKQNVLELKTDWSEIAKQIKSATESFTTSVANYTLRLADVLGDGYGENPFWSSIDQLLVEFSREYYGEVQIPLSRALDGFVNPILRLATGENPKIPGAAEMFNEAKRIQILFNDLSTKGLEIFKVVEMVDKDLPKTNERMEVLIQTHFDPNFTKEKQEEPKETA